MRTQRISQIILTLWLCSLALAACGATSPTAMPPGPSSPPQRSPTEAGRCGDGVCDEAEQANPALCPQDCGERTVPPGGTPGGTSPCGDGVCDEREQLAPALCPQDCMGMPGGEPPGATATPTPVAGVGLGDCTAGEWLLVGDACVDWHGNAEPSGHVCSSFEICLAVDAQCNIQGSGRGQYAQDTCAFTSPGGCMSYEVTCPDFSISASGEMITDTLWIQLDGSQIVEQVVATEICVAGEQVYSGRSTFVQTGFGSATRNGGGYLCAIEALDGAHIEVTGVDAVAPDVLSYSFTVDLYAGCGAR